MALYIDGNLNGLEELQKYESSILDVASTEGIDVTEKIELARREIGLELTTFLLRQSALPFSRRDLSGVIVTEPLLQWHALHTLSLVYRDAYNNQLNERYTRKLREYERLSSRASSQLWDAGVGTVSTPVRRAPRPSCGSLPGGNLVATTYYVRAAWQNMTGTVGVPSDASVIEVGAGSVLTVMLAAGAASVAGFYVYSGVSEECTRQSELVPPGSTWVMPESGLRVGDAPPTGQQPEQYISRRRAIPRG